MMHDSYFDVDQRLIITISIINSYKQTILQKIA
jgi:hypothetical protein